MTTKLKKSFLFFAGMIGGIILVVIYGFDDEETKYTRLENQNNPSLPWHAPAIPSNLSFAGDDVPMKRSEIRQQFDRELLIINYNQGQLLYIMKLAKMYFPIIEERLKANGVPDDFKYLCVAESNLQNLISKAGAVGYWQFMPNTAPGYGMEVNNYVDDRYHLIKSTDAACAYLKSAYTRFGNWTAAAASYNCGMGGYGSRASFQGTNNYYDLLLPDETNKYIFRILAFKYILQNPEKTGFSINNEDYYDEIPVKEIIITNSISNLAQWAKSNGTTYKMVRLLNPWLRSTTLQVKPGKTYRIKVPIK